MPITFKNPQVAAQFETDYNRNVTIRIPKVWAGKLRNITPEAAEVFASQGNRHFRKKEVATPAPEPSPPAERKRATKADLQNEPPTAG